MDQHSVRFGREERWSSARICKIIEAIPEAEVLAMALGYYTPTEILCIKDCID